MIGDDFCTWDLRHSVAAFQQDADEPRNWYARNEARTRAVWGEMADQVLSTVPERSNDFWLDDCLNTLIHLAPASVRHQIEGIFAIRTPSLEVNAEAWMTDGPGHLIGMFDGVRAPIMAYGLLLRRCVQLFLDQGQAGHESIEAVVDAVGESMPDLLGRADVRTVLAARSIWRSSPDAFVGPELADLLNSDPEQTTGGASVLHEYLDAAEHFLLAHEVAHHLLGHTRPPIWPTCSHPAILLLAEARDGLRIEQDTCWSTSQQEELDADAFGFLLFAGWYSKPPVLPPRWYRAITGALLALPLLEDLATETAPRPQIRSLAVVAPDYPPLSVRIQQIEQMVLGLPREPTVDENGQPNHPIGLLLQMTVFREFLRQITN